MGSSYLNAGMILVYRSVSQLFLTCSCQSSLNYHATSHLDPPHPTYPSQQIHSSILSSDLQAPMLESPSYSQDRESISDSVHDDESHPIPRLPSYHFSHSIPPTPPQGSNPFKRPFQPEMMTPVSSPQSHGPPAPKRRKSSASRTEAWTMTEDDTLLLQLKDEDSLPWKVIASRFKDLNRGEFRVPTLQMRYKRLKEKMRVWDAEDVRRLPSLSLCLEVIHT